MSKPPKVGDRIIHKERYFNRKTTGTVVQLLSMQFVYEPDNSKVSRFCMFREDWEHIDNDVKAKRRK